MKQKQLESQIVAAICQYLSLKKHLFWRSNNVPVYDPTRKAFRAMPKYTMKGLPDIVVIQKGQYIGLEVKREKTYQSDEQKAFEKLSKAYGAAYFVVRSVEDLIKLGL